MSNPNLKDFQVRDENNHNRGIIRLTREEAKIVQDRMSGIPVGFGLSLWPDPFEQQEESE